MRQRDQGGTPQSPLGFGHYSYDRRRCASEESEPVNPPPVVYHATRPVLLRAIIHEGIRSKSGFSHFGGQTGVSTTTDLDVVSGGNFGNLVLELSTSGMRGKFSFYKFQHPTAPAEKELRVVDEGKDETVVPFKHVQALYFLTPKLRKFEAREIANMVPSGVEMYTLWHGEKTPIS